MLKKLFKAVAKREKQVNEICSHLDALQTKALNNLQQSVDKRH